MYQKLKVIFLQKFVAGIVLDDFNGSADQLLIMPDDFIDMLTLQPKSSFISFHCSLFCTYMQ